MIPRTIAFIVMVCAIALPSGSAAQEVHVVTQTGFTFAPADLTIQVGDTVRWIHTGGIHTVTSGEGAIDPNVGAVFDSPLSAAAPLFEWVSTEIGELPYFCRPHESFNMKGIIRVEIDATASPSVSSRRLLLEGVYPNPFNPRTTIRFSLLEATRVDLSIHDVRGRLVRHLLRGTPMEAADHQILWDGRDDGGRAIPSGVYHVRMEASGVRASARATLVR